MPKKGKCPLIGGGNLLGSSSKLHQHIPMYTLDPGVSTGQQETLHLLSSYCVLHPPPFQMQIHPAM